VASAFLPDSPAFYPLVAAYLVWVLSEIVGARILPRRRADGAHEVVRSDRSSRGAIFLGIFLSVALIAFLVGLGWATLPLPVVYAGVALMLVGVAVRQWAIVVLGRFFSTSVRLLEDHDIVARGPYRLLRHPSYSGAILTMLGLALAGGTWEGVVVVASVAGVVFGYRIRVEEQFLIDHLGAKYLDYRRRTKRLVPFLF
jgi:protein-S-isoprenylcysteine O-methyltransferase Ste14